MVVLLLVTLSGEQRPGWADFFKGVFTDALSSIMAWSLAKKLLVIVALAVVVTITTTTPLPSALQLRQWSQQLGPGFIAVFFLGYVLITQFPIPRTIFTLSSGLLLGPAVGIAVALTATVCSAAVSLSIVRRLLGAWMAPRLNHPAVADINHRLETRGWLAITSLRMMAAVPFSLLNYTAALTSVPLWQFCVATALGSAPGTIATVLLGDALTGTVHPAMFAVTIILFACGSCGLILDRFLPVKN